MENNFEDARTATEEMFNVPEQETLDDAPIEEQAEETPIPTEEVPTEEGATLDDAVNTAEIAAQTAAQKEEELQSALRELEILKAQNQQIQGTLEELSQSNKETLIEEAMKMPTLDVNGLAFADEETVAKAQEEYARQMAEFVKGDVLKEVSPFVEQAKEGIYQKEKTEAVSSLSQVPELAGIDTMLPQLEKIIANNKWLQSDDMPIDEKLINAYAIAKGVNAINTPPEPPKELTADELMELYEKTPSFQELIEKKRIEAIKQNGQQVPPFSASSGAVNAALNIQEKPQNWDEAAERTRKMFG